ncbi:hypothetical protein [Bartonella sp. cb54]|uniref:hypothetical protein n=1 Tax=Bartonella sp. cb54 TaxID=3385560 RepID=UPI0039A532F6
MVSSSTGSDDDGNDCNDKSIDNNDGAPAFSQPNTDAVGNSYDEVYKEDFFKLVENCNVSLKVDKLKNEIKDTRCAVLVFALIAEVVFLPLIKSGVICAFANCDEDHAGFKVLFLAILLQIILIIWPFYPILKQVNKKGFGKAFQDMKQDLMSGLKYFFALVKKWWLLPLLWLLL